jgi:hypothetical protein
MDILKDDGILIGDMDGDLQDLGSEVGQMQDHKIMQAIC